MGLKIACQMHERTLCFEVLGGLSDHLDSVARYVRGKAAHRDGVMVDIRGATRRPGADKLFIHVLKYPGICSCKIALVDFEENWVFCSLFEHLLRRRGYQICSFANVDTARQWLSTDLMPARPKHRMFLVRQILAAIKERLKPMRFSHATTTSH